METKRILQTTIFLFIFRAMSASLQLNELKCSQVGMNGPCSAFDCVAVDCLSYGCSDCVDACEPSSCRDIDVECISEGLVCRCCGGIGIKEQSIKQPK